MEMIGHQDKGDQLAWPLAIQVGKHIDESLAASWIVKDRQPVYEVPRNKVKRAEETHVGPFASHER